MIDLHSHVLPGIDDGPETIEGSVALARAAVAAGIDTLVATPHVSAHYPNDAETIGDLVAVLASRLEQERIPLALRAGAEVSVSHMSELDPGELPRLRLGGGPWLLVEPPFSPVAPGLEERLTELQREHRLVLAHPERCPALQRRPETVSALAARGVLMSVTAGSLVGRFGRGPARFALELFGAGLVHNVASDAHDTERRAPGMSEELERAGLGELAPWLTSEVPAAVLAGETIPDPPPLRARFWRWRAAWRR